MLDKQHTSQPQEAKPIDLSHIRPYGDTLDDGKIQLSFTLPVPDDEKGIEAARQLITHMGLEHPVIAWHQALDKQYTFYVAYGSFTSSLNYHLIEVETVGGKVWSMGEIDQLIREQFGRKIKVLGASTGTDAHTVGIDAIMNMKGYDGHFGLERYEMFEAINLGSQVDNEDFIRRAVEEDTDVLLVSQTVTQKDIHIKNLTALVELLEAEGLRERFLLIIGGARISHELAKELGCDAGFGPGKYADDVASFIVEELLRRRQTAVGM